MLEFIKDVNIAGWISITIIATLIFIVLMFRGIRLCWGDKSVGIGKKLDNKLDAFKKDLELERMKKNQDENLQKALFKKSIAFDNYLKASLIKSVKKLENDVYNIFKPFLICQYPALCVADIFEDVLMERVHFNNMKKKLTKENQVAYLHSIVEDIKKNYITFYEQLLTLHCGEVYPEWDKIEESVIFLVKKWLLQCLDCYIMNVSKKMALYKKKSAKFVFEDMRELAITLPLKKNKHYFFDLLKAKKELMNDEVNLKKEFLNEKDC